MAAHAGSDTEEKEVNPIMSKPKKSAAPRGKSIDLNADLGEGMASDPEMMKLVSSANIACGFHAGDAETMLKMIALARGKRVTFGAHPGYNDRPNFGRTELAILPSAVVAEVVYQIGALLALGQSFEKDILYIKPHGALYHKACREREYAEAIVWAASQFELAVLGLPNSELEKEARDKKVHFYREGFADRRYDTQGQLISRDRPNAFISDPSEATEQVLRLIQEQGVQSICVHGDKPEAVQFTEALRSKLVEAGYEILPFIE